MNHRVLLLGALAAALTIVSAAPAFACINAQDKAVLRALAEGHEVEATALQALTKAHDEKPTLENGNDLGAALIVNGRLEDAVKLLEETDGKFPGSARVAANLGAALERAGRNDQALAWIRKSIERDANENGGSEWLHARILEAQIALAKDPAWLDDHRVLELDFGQDEVPTAPEILPIENGRIKGAVQLLEQIGYQLTGRTRFVKPPDRVVGDLYASEGDLAIAGAVSPLDDRKSTFTPDRYYEQALAYGAPHADLIRKRLARYRADLAALPPAPQEAVADYPVVSKRFEKPAPKSNAIWIYVGAATAFTLVLVVIGMLLDRRRRKREEATPSASLPDIE
jgi:tetratricopeptide (TPR) repeat protein